MKEKFLEYYVYIKLLANYDCIHPITNKTVFFRKHLPLNKAGVARIYEYNKLSPHPTPESVGGALILSPNDKISIFQIGDILINRFIEFLNDEFEHPNYRKFGIEKPQIYFIRGHGGSIEVNFTIALYDIPEDMEIYN